MVQQLSRFETFEYKKWQFYVATITEIFTYTYIGICNTKFYKFDIGCVNYAHFHKSDHIRIIQLGDSYSQCTVCIQAKSFCMVN